MKQFAAIVITLLLGLVLLDMCVPRGSALQSSQLYGNEGYNVIGDSVQYPAYANVTVNRVEQTVVWASSTNDVRALEKATSFSGDRIAAAWSSMQSSFDVEIQITDGETHQVSFYFLDWEALGRKQNIAVIEYSTPEGVLRDYRAVEDFSGGKWFSYTISGRVLFRFWRNSPFDAVLSGIFFDPKPTSTIILSPDTLRLRVGEQSQVFATIYDANGLIVTSPPAIFLPIQGQTTCVSVDSVTGLVTATREGQCGIGAITSNSLKSRFPVRVTVLPAASPSPSPTPEPTPTATPTPEPTPTATPTPTPTPSPSPSPTPTPVPVPTPTPCLPTNWPSSIQGQNQRMAERRAQGCYPVRRTSGSMEYARP